MPVDVVTGDRDLFQLIDDSRGIRVVYTAARGVGRAEVYDEKALLAKYDIPANRYADFATLRGDASDGLPGVKGIGEKTAASLVTAYGDLDAIRAAAADREYADVAVGEAEDPGGEPTTSTSPRRWSRSPRTRRSARSTRRSRTRCKDPERWLDLVELLELGGSAQRVMSALNLGPKA